MIDHVWLYNPDTDAYWQSPADYAGIAKARGWEDSEGPADPDAEALAAEPPPESAPVDETDVQTSFDPSDHTVAEVNVYLDQYRDDAPGEIERVLSLERAGKNRTSIIGV